MQSSAPADFFHLIPDLKNWNDGDGIEPEYWATANGSTELAIGYSLIFWPRFVLIDDHVLRHGETLDDLRVWQEAGTATRQQIEAVMNHVHIVDLHEQEATEDQLRYLGRTLREIHEVKLAADFPDRRFVVSFPDEPGLDVYDYQLTFWQA